MMNEQQKTVLQRAGYRSGNILDSYSGVSSSNLNTDFSWFASVSSGKSLIIPRLGHHHRFLPNPFQIGIDLQSEHSTLCILATDRLGKLPSPTPQNKQRYLQERLYLSGAVETMRNACFNVEKETAVSNSVFMGVVMLVQINSGLIPKIASGCPRDKTRHVFCEV
jgi:hypothetical protein